MTKGSKVYVPLLRRRREGKTDYRERKALLLGRHTFVVFRASNKNILVQLVEPCPGGDRVLLSIHSRELLKVGWKGSRKSLPAAYLTGLVAGLQAAKKGIGQATLYTGVKPYVRASRMVAAVKGMVDGGLSIPFDIETLPKEDRIKGKAIADHARNLLAKDKLLYKARFSRLVGSGFGPEGYPEHFDEVRMKVLEKFG